MFNPEGEGREFTNKARKEGKPRTDESTVQKRTPESNRQPPFSDQYRSPGLRQSSKLPIDPSLAFRPQTKHIRHYPGQSLLPSGDVERGSKFTAALTRRQTIFHRSAGHRRRVRFRASSLPLTLHLHLIHHSRWFCLRPASEMNVSKPLGPLKILHVPARRAAKQHLLRHSRPSPSSSVPRSELPILFSAGDSLSRHPPCPPPFFSFCSGASLAVARGNLLACSRWWG